MLKLFGIPLYKKYIKNPKKRDPLGVFVWIIVAIPLSLILTPIPLFLFCLIFHFNISTIIFWIIIGFGAIIIAFWGIKINPWYVGYDSAMKDDPENEMPPFAGL